ncbi:hypothetical protein [Desulfobacter sp.]|uniref:hypothetical protein n=1 Tax=Desulfobacter sp. TaxID=2294 RepID=UPI003D13F331
MSTGNKKFVFEAITENQAWKIMASCNQPQEFDTEKLYSMIHDLTGIPSLHSLSKQEASFIIDRLQGCTKWNRPLGPRTIGQIKGDARDLPALGHILFIRESVQALGWDKAHFKAWLEKYIKAGNLNELTRETARKAYIGLMKIRINKMES